MATVLVLWVLVVSVVVSVAELVLGRAGIGAFPLAFLSMLVSTLFKSGGYLTHCWFLWALAFLYLALPPLSRLSQKAKLSLLVVTVLLGFAVHAASCVAGHPLEAAVPKPFRIWTWLEYFLLGGMLYPRFKDKLRVGPTGMLLVAATVLAVAWQVFAGSELIPIVGDVSYVEYFYASPTEVLWCSALLLFCQSLRPGPKPWVWLASLTMGVYLLHRLVIRMLGHFISFDDILWGSGVGFLVVLLTSFVVIGLLKKYLPKVFKLFCAV